MRESRWDKKWWLKEERRQTQRVASGLLKGSPLAPTRQTKTSPEKDTTAENFTYFHISLYVLVYLHPPSIFPLQSLKAAHERETTRAAAVGEVDKHPWPYMRTSQEYTPCNRSLSMPAWQRAARKHPVNETGYFAQPLYAVSFSTCRAFVAGDNGCEIRARAPAPHSGPVSSETVAVTAGLLKQRRPLFFPFLFLRTLFSSPQTCRIWFPFLLFLPLSCPCWSRGPRFNSPCCR